jgi:hypothetical protein
VIRATFRRELGRPRGAGLRDVVDRTSHDDRLIVGSLRADVIGDRHACGAPGELLRYPGGDVLPEDERR